MAELDFPALDAAAQQVVKGGEGLDFSGLDAAASSVLQSKPVPSEPSPGGRRKLDPRREWAEANSEPSMEARLRSLASHHGLKVTSGRRSAEQNRKAGGSPTSRHLSGQALDLAGDPVKMKAFADDAAKLGLHEVFYDPWGGMKKGVRIGAIGGHGDHVHVSWGAPSARAKNPGLDAAAGALQTRRVKDPSFGRPVQGLEFNPATGKHGPDAEPSLAEQLVGGLMRGSTQESQKTVRLYDQAVAEGKATPRPIARSHKQALAHQAIHKLSEKYAQQVRGKVRAAHPQEQVLVQGSTVPPSEDAMRQEASEWASFPFALQGLLGRRPTADELLAAKSIADFRGIAASRSKAEHYAIQGDVAVSGAVEVAAALTGGLAPAAMWAGRAAPLVRGAVRYAAPGAVAGGIQQAGSEAAYSGSTPRSIARAGVEGALYGGATSAAAAGVLKGAGAAIRRAGMAHEAAVLRRTPLPPEFGTPVVGSANARGARPGVPRTPRDAALTRSRPVEMADTSFHPEGAGVGSTVVAPGGKTPLQVVGISRSATGDLVAEIAAPGGQTTLIPYQNLLRFSTKVKSPVGGFYGGRVGRRIAGAQPLPNPGILKSAQELGDEGVTVASRNAARPAFGDPDFVGPDQPLRTDPTTALAGKPLAPVPAPLRTAEELAIERTRGMKSGKPLVSAREAAKQRRIAQGGTPSPRSAGAVVLGEESPAPQGPLEIVTGSRPRSQPPPVYRGPFAPSARTSSRPDLSSPTVKPGAVDSATDEAIEAIFGRPGQKIHLSPPDLDDTDPAIRRIFEGVPKAPARRVIPIEVDGAPTPKVKGRAPRTPKAEAQPGQELAAPTPQALERKGTRRGLSPAKPHVPTPVAADVIRGRTPKNMEQAVQDLERAVNSPVPRTGQRRGVAGVYKPFTGGATVGNRRDLGVVAHEVAGHLADDSVGITNTLTPQMEQELEHPAFGRSVPRTAGPPNPQVEKAERFAEWMVAYVANPGQAEQMAPALAAHVRSKLPVAVMRGIDQFSQDYRTLLGASATDAIGAGVRLEKPKVGAVAQAREYVNPARPGAFRHTVVDDFLAKVTDDLHPVKKAFHQAARMQGVAPKPSENAQFLLENVAGENQKVIRWLGVSRKGGPQGPVTADGTPVKGLEGGVQAVLKHLDTTSEKTLRDEVKLLGVHMIAEQDIARANRIIRSGGDPAEAALSGGSAGRSAYENALLHMREFNALPQAQKNRIMRAAHLYRRLTANALQYAASKGRMDPKVVSKILADNPHYVSLGRVMDDSAAGKLHAGAGNRIGTRAGVVHEFHGSTAESENPIVNLMENIARVVKETDRNEAMVAFTRVLESERGLHSPLYADLQSIGRRLREAEEGSFRVFADGELQHWKFDEAIEAALRGWGQVSDPADIQIKMASLLKSAITHSPPYAMRNLIRDTQERLILAEHPGGIRAATSGIKLEGLEGFEYGGGGGSGVYDISSADGYYRLLDAAMDRVAKQKNTTVLGTLRKGTERYSDAMESTELMNRVASYDAAKEWAQKQPGWSARDVEVYATNQARSATLDFNVQGSWTRKANRRIPFLSAVVGGARRITQEAVRNPKRLAARTALVIGMPSILELAANIGAGKLEEWRDLPMWRKATSYNLPGPDGGWVTIPKPQVVGVVGTSLSLGMDRALGNSRAFDGYQMELLRAIPFSNPDQFIGAAVRAATELATNYNLYEDRHIIPPAEEKLEVVRRRGADHASALSKTIAKGPFGQYQFDPRYLDHILNQTGDYGRAAQRISDFMSGNARETTATTVIQTLGFGRPQEGAGAAPVTAVTEAINRRGDGAKNHAKALYEMIAQAYEAKPGPERKKRKDDIVAYARPLRDYYEGTANPVAPKTAKARMLDDKLKEIGLKPVWQDTVTPILGDRPPAKLQPRQWKAIQNAYTRQAYDLLADELFPRLEAGPLANDASTQEKIFQSLKAKGIPEEDARYLSLGKKTPRDQAAAIIRRALDSISQKALAEGMGLR